MIGNITIRERGATPGILKREMNRLMKSQWRETGIEHHKRHTHKRFTPAHARLAGYGRRKGELQPRDSKAGRRSYYWRKFRDPNRGGGPNRADPLVNTGRTLMRSRFVKVTSTSKRVRLRYNTPALNFRHPKSRLRPAEEFRKIIPAEKKVIIKHFDGGLDKRIDSLRATKSQTIT